jgi:hypothetical protein
MENTSNPFKILYNQAKQMPITLGLSVIVLGSLIAADAITEFLWHFRLVWNNRWLDLELSIVLLLGLDISMIGVLWLSKTLKRLGLNYECGKRETS